MVAGDSKTLQAARSLSDFGIVGCECVAAAHFSPASCPIAPLWGGESGKNWPRWGAFSLSTPKVRQAPRHRSADSKWELALTITLVVCALALVLAERIQS
jgi:hypothetical protein